MRRILRNFRAVLSAPQAGFERFWNKQDGEKENGMRTSGWEERLRKLDETARAFQVARRAAMGGDGNGPEKVQGWLRTVRRAVGVPAADVAARMGVVESDIYRMEVAEGRGAIELQTLRRAAEALGCELVYGLAPKEGTLTEMSAAIEAGRAKKRVDAKARKLAKAKDERHEAARKRWHRQEQKRIGDGWEEYWRIWPTPLSVNERRSIPKPVRETPFWRKQMQKAIRAALRREGIRLR
jgi:predicted DNA-binding mobile mystery protein A